MMRAPEEPLAEGAAALADAARKAFSAETSELTHERQWRRLEQVHLPAGHRGWPQRRWLGIAAVVGVGVIGAVVLSSRRENSPPLTFTTYGLPSDAANRYFYAPAQERPAGVHFSDGTDVRLAAMTRARLTEMTGRGARLALEDGQAHVQVVHRPEAQWTVDAGPFTVQVTGTLFDVRWSAATEVLDVTLMRGSVRVMAPFLPSPVGLQGGQHLVADARTGKVAVTTEPLAPTTIVPTAVPLPAEAPVAVDKTRAAVVHLPWSLLVARGAYQRVLDEARGRKLASCLDRCSARDLEALADAARYGREPVVARQALLATRTRFAGSEAAHTAAFLLGRLIEDEAGGRAEALSWYDRYLAESPEGRFASDALGRKMLVLNAQGKPGQAAALARDYVHRFPRGAYAHTARKLSEEP